MERITIEMHVLNGNERKYIDECIDTGWISANGRFISEFEKKFAEFCGVKYALACSNGTVTLHLAMLALGIKPGDEVIMPTLTYIATANAVKYCGAKPVFVDSDPGTWNIDPKKIEEKINEHTKAIIDVYKRQASALIAEMALYHKSQGRTLYQALEALMETYGCFQDKLVSVILPGQGGQRQIGEIMDRLRVHYHTLLEEEDPAVWEDYQLSLIHI